MANHPAVLRSGAPRCHVLVEDPSLAERLGSQRRTLAIEECVARVIELHTGDWTPAVQRPRMRYGIGLLLLHGLIARRVKVEGRFGAELLGPGDLLRPWQNEDLQATLPHTGDWRILHDCRMAVLDSEFARRLANYPEITSALFARAVRRARQLAVTVAILHQPRIELRLQMLLWELADRWGTVHSDGVHLPVRLTHSMLAELIGARRPTVSKALGELAESGQLEWTGDCWLLCGTAPTHLEPIAAAPTAQH